MRPRPKAQLSRRDFLGRSGSLAALGMFPAAMWGRERTLDTVCLMHTTDLHGNILPTSTYGGTPDVGGLARCATRIKQWQQQFPHHLLFDLGDLYQGTEVGYRTEGQVMIRCLNHLGYDGWVLGNHDFDWGGDPLQQAIAASSMPTLCANSRWDGKRVWHEGERDKVPLHPWVLREVNGYRIAFIGLTTPGIPNWFLPEMLSGFSVTDPVESLRPVIREIKATEPDAIILGSHMGIRPGMTDDDTANRLFAIARAFPQIDAIVGGHTHRDMANERIEGIPYSQANYFGIHVGRLDLVFDRNSRRLMHVQPLTSYMDSAVEPDPEVIALTQDEVEASRAYLDREVGRLEERLSLETSPADPSGIERLIGTAVVEGLSRRGIAVDACLHGLIYQDEPVHPGIKRIEDFWDILPFENFMVTAELTREQLIAVLEEVYRQRNIRSLIGLPCVELRGSRNQTRIVSLKDAAGEEWPADRPIRLALNSYDAASGGGRFPKLRAILDEPSSKRKLHPIQIRAVLIDWFKRNSPVSLESLL